MAKDSSLETETAKMTVIATVRSLHSGTERGSSSGRDSEIGKVKVMVKEMAKERGKVRERNC